MKVNLMMKQKPRLFLLIPVLVLFLCILPAAAVVQEVTVKSSVSTLSPQKNTLTIGYPLQYGCSYPATGSPICTYTPTNYSSLTGTVPNEAAFTMFKTGDPIVGTSFGGAGDRWIALAKLFGSRPNEENVTALVGDPGSIPTPLIGDYALDITMNPDCTACTGTICTATSADVNVLSGGSRVMQKTLKPGGALLFNGRNDGSSLSLTFVSGEAMSATCAGGAGMAGPQPISVFVLTVVPPAAFAQTDIRTASTTSPEEALSTLPITTLTGITPPTAVPVATKAGSLPFAVVGALGITTALVLAARKP
jgi:hypothetical protein